jgi:hypothetical protein
MQTLGSTGLNLTPWGITVTDDGHHTTEASDPPCNDIPADGPRELLGPLCKQLASPTVFQARVGPGAWDRNGMAAVCERLLSALGRESIEIWQLAPFDKERIKAGEPARAMMKLRDRGLVRFFSVRVSDLRSAEWVLQSFPLHTFTIDGPIELESWRALLDEARASGIGVLATGAAFGGDRDVAMQLIHQGLVTAVAL